MEKKRTYGALTVYRERGYYLKRLEQYEKAKAAYDTAYCSAPDNVRNLIGRSQVCAKALLPLQAYADSKLALELEPSMHAMNVQAQALYTMSNFENALIMNYVGAESRQQPPYFSEGIIQGIQTIEDCIGTNAGHVMLDLLPVIKKQEVKSKARQNAVESEITKSSHECRIPQPQLKEKITQIQARKHSNMSKVLAMKYLGPMAHDKFFLENLAKDPRLKSANATKSDQVQDLVNQTLNSLVECQEMLRKQRPYYTIKLAEKSESKHLNQFKKSMLHHDRKIATRIAERLQNEIKECLKNKLVKELMTTAERFQKFLDSKTKKILPDKDAYIDRLYRNIGQAYLSQHRLSYSLSDKSNRRRIAFLMGLPTERTNSVDSVVANIAPRSGDMKLVTERVMKSLEICEHPTMRCWLSYELARLLCLQKKYTRSKFYAKQCQRESQEIDSVVWWLNGCFVLVSGAMQQGQATEVKLHVEEAYEWSKKMYDPERVQSFLSECARMAAEIVVVDDRKDFKHREKQILSVMNEEQRDNTKILFKRISVLPFGRRFPVLPSRVEPKHANTERSRNKQKGLSVIDGLDKGIPKFPKSRIAGYQNFDL